MFWRSYSQQQWHICKSDLIRESYPLINTGSIRHRPGSGFIRGAAVEVGEMNGSTRSAPMLTDDATHTYCRFIHAVELVPRGRISTGITNGVD